MNMDTETAIKILAKSLCRKLICSGLTNQDIVDITKEILDYMSNEMLRKPLQRIPEKSSPIDKGWIHMVQASAMIG